MRLSSDDLIRRDLDLSVTERFVIIIHDLLFADHSRSLAIVGRDRIRHMRKRRDTYRRRKFSGVFEPAFAYHDDVARDKIFFESRSAVYEDMIYAPHQRAILIRSVD